MKIEVITQNKFEDIRNGLLKYGVAYNYPKTIELSSSFLAVGTLIDEMLKMYQGQAYAAIEVEGRRNGIIDSLGRLNQELKYHFEDTPDEITKNALSDFDDYMNIFK